MLREGNTMEWFEEDRDEMPVLTSPAFRTKYPEEWEQAVQDVWALAKRKARIVKVDCWVGVRKLHNWGGPPVNVRRLAWIIRFGEPPGARVRALTGCGTSGCFNPDHLLEAPRPQEPFYRDEEPLPTSGVDPMAVLAAAGRAEVNFCPRGHVKAPGNLVVSALKTRGARNCRLCHLAMVRRGRARRAGLELDLAEATRTVLAQHPHLEDYVL